MRALGWVFVALAPVALVLGGLIGRENMRVYAELCRRGWVQACRQDGMPAVWMGLSIAVGLFAFGVIILAIRRPRKRRRRRQGRGGDDDTMRGGLASWDRY
jgi:hypothetical protein